MTRVGKIARLPRHRREQLNQRLADGESGRTLVHWLNGKEDVREVLSMNFGGKSFTEQNLSEWKRGGYKEWLRHQEMRAEVRGFLAEAEELEDEVGDTPLSDRATEMAAFALLRLLREADAEKGPSRRAAVLEIVREMQRLRRGDNDMERRRIEQERWEAEREAANQAEIKAMEDKIQFQKIKTEVAGGMLSKEYRDGMADGTLAPERAEELRKYFKENAEWLRDCGAPDIPPLGHPAKSDQIRPNPTESDRCI